MHLRKTPLLTTLALAAALPGGAAAQDNESITTLPTVRVTGEADQPGYSTGTTGLGKAGDTALRDIPQAVTVINEQVMEAQGTRSLTEALRNVPGITISAGEGGQIGDNINLRGFSARTDLFLDGMRDRGQYARDVFALEAVEVLKGPSSMLFGRGSTGGVINQVSKKPRLRQIREIEAGIGTEDTYRLTGDLNQPIGENSAFRVALMGQTNGSSRDVIEAEQYGVAPSIAFGLGTPTTVTLQALLQHRKEVPDYGFPFVNGKPLEADRDNFYGFTDDTFEQDVGIFTARIEHAFSKALTLRNQTQYAQASVHAMPTTINDSGARNRRERDVDDSSLFNQTDLIARFATGSVKHTLVGGVEIGRDEYENQGYDWAGEPNQSLSDPTYGPMPASVVRTETTLQNATGDTFAVYLNDTLELGEHWKLVGGLRWDRFEVQHDTHDAAGALTDSVGRTDRMTSVRAGAIYQPTETQSYYVSYGTSFNPSAETVSLRARDEAAAPEKNRSYELGGKWDLLDGGLQLNAAVFRVEKTDAHEVDPLTGLSEPTGKIRVDGFEIGAAGQITPAWQVFGGYTYLDGKIVESSVEQDGVSIEGKVLPNTPTHSATLWTTYRVLTNWEVGGGAVYSSDRYVRNSNASQVDGYTRFDATVAYRQKDYDLRLNLLNLTNEEYFGVASGGRATPAERRAAMLTLSYRL